MAATALSTPFATPEELVLQLKTLPPAPRILLSLQRMAGCDGSTVEELVSLIRIERALAARIVKVSNSPFYNLGTRCDTIEESVKRLGFKEVHQLAVTVTACETLSHPFCAYPVTTHSLWNQSVGCALAAEHLAYLTGEDEPIAYAAGLMHSVGMIVTDTWIQHLAPGTILSYDDTATEWSLAEQKLLGYDQAGAGAALLDHWKFPKPIVEAIRHQYATQKFSAQRRLAAMIALGRWLAKDFDHEAKTRDDLPDNTALITLRISDQQLAQCGPEISRRMEKARQIFGAM